MYRTVRRCWRRDISNGPLLRTRLKNVRIAFGSRLPFPNRCVPSSVSSSSSATSTITVSSLLGSVLKKSFDHSRAHSNSVSANPPMSFTGVLVRMISFRNAVGFCLGIFQQQFFSRASGPVPGAIRNSRSASFRRSFFCRLCRLCRRRHQKSSTNQRATALFSFVVALWYVVVFLRSLLLRIIIICC